MLSFVLKLRLLMRGVVAVRFRQIIASLALQDTNPSILDLVAAQHLTQMCMQEPAG